MAKSTIITEQQQLDFIQSEKLTEIEKFNIRSYFFEPTQANKEIAYKQSNPEVTQSNNMVHYTTAEKQWFLKKPVQAYLRILKTRYMITDSDATNIEDIDLGEDFTDLKNQVKRYALIYRNSDDNRTRMAALEKIDKLTGTGKGKDDSTKVIFYLPLRCFDCRLYRENQAKIRNETGTEDVKR